MADYPTVHYTEQGKAALSLVPAQLDGADSDGLVWHPIMRVGKWRHPKFGEFSITPQDLEEMKAAFMAGIPTSIGIPIDERGDHSFSADGSFGWLRKLEIRGDTLWAGIEYTDMGRKKVQSRELPFISPHFFLGAEPDPVYGARTFIESAALTSRPFFWDQPHLSAAMIAADAYVAEPLEATPEKDGGDKMPEGTREQIEKLLGRKLADQEWEALAVSGGETNTDGGDTDMPDSADENVVTAQAEAAGDGQAQRTVAEEQPDSGTDQAMDTADGAAEEEAATEQTDTVGTINIAEVVAEIQAELSKLAKEVQAMRAEEAKAGHEMAASATAAGQGQPQDARSVEDVKKDLAAASLGQDGGKRLAPSAVEVLANALANPCHETAEALWKHLEANGGALQAYRPGEVTAAVPTDAKPDVMAEIEALPLAPSSKARLLEQHKATGKPVKDLYREYMIALNSGRV